MICPKCSSNKIVKNGSIHNGKPKFKCNNCDRQFVENPKNKRISPDIKLIVDKLLLEKISLAGICRATGVSPDWLYSYIKDK
jgi:transposase-like protein